jgi:hypothetical protein
MRAQPKLRTCRDGVCLLGWRFHGDAFSRERLGEFRFVHRFEDRTKAIRRLLEFALNQNPKPKK